MPWCDGGGQFEVGRTRSGRCRAPAANLRRMQLAIYAHPWDLRDLPAHGGLQRLVDLGFGEVALAVSYHAGRWLTPWNSRGMVRFLEDGTVHFRPRADYGRLRPQTSSEVPAEGASPLSSLIDDAARVGMRSRAWTVCTHNTRLGELHPECTVENAFGDRYSYALCPAQPAVQQYVQTLVTDLAAHRGLDTIELESFGWLGHRHNSHHDKNSFAAEPRSDLLLSLCFCEACRLGMQNQKIEGRDGIDVEALRQGVQRLLRQHFADGDAMTAAVARPSRKELLEELRRELGDGILAAVGWRLLVQMTSIAKARQTAVQASVRVALQTNFDALRGGAAMPLAVLGGFVDEAVLTTYHEKAEAVGAAMPHLLAARGGEQNPPLPEARWPQLRLCLHPRAPQYQTDADLERVRQLCLEHKVQSLAIYHLGLLPWRTIERAAAVLQR